jgi:hypothetical protein
MKLGFGGSGRRAPVIYRPRPPLLAIGCDPTARSVSCLMGRAGYAGEMGWAILGPVRKGV